MMPIVEQNSISHHHHHGHGHQTFYQEEHISETTSKIPLTLILPNGVPSVLNIDANTPMMDLLVHAASLNKLNPSSYSLVVLDSNQHVIHFKPNQTVGQIVKNCRLPQINGSSTISLLPKETTHSNSSSSKPKTQPFEITVRLLVNLPDAQKILLRIDPTLPLHEIKEQICKQKKYTNSNEYTLRLPDKLDQPLLLGLSLAEYKTNELTLIHQKPFDTDRQSNLNQLQSFDRLYRVRSESQPRKDHLQQNEPQIINTKPINHTSSTRSSSRPSHTTLHAYWNDPNFDTQSQVSNVSSIMKKRRAPRPPSFMSSSRPESHTIIPQSQTANDIHSLTLPLRSDHHQSRESLQSENTKKKRKAPVVAPTNSVQKQDDHDKIEQQQQQQQTNVTNSIARPGLEPPPPPTMMNAISPSTNNLNRDLHSTGINDLKSVDEALETIDSSINHTDDNQLTSNFSDNQTNTDDKLVITTNSLESTNSEIYSPSSTYSSEPVQTYSPSSTTSNIRAGSEEKSVQVEDLNLVEPSVPKPPRQNFLKEKKSATFNGHIRTISHHNDQYNDHQKSEIKSKETNENVSYFRVAKSRYGKFETENRNFINNSIAIFDSTNQLKSEQSMQKNSQSSELSNSKQQKPNQFHTIMPQTKGKQVYSILKKYEKEEQYKVTDNIDYLKITKQQGKPLMAHQFESTEQPTKMKVIVENDHKQLTSRDATVFQPASSPPPPPIFIPKPFGKSITEYRAVRPIDKTNETIIRKHDSFTSSNGTNFKPQSADVAEKHDALMESIRNFGGLKNLRKI